MKMARPISPARKGNILFRKYPSLITRNDFRIDGLFPSNTLQAIARVNKEIKVNATAIARLIGLIAVKAISNSRQLANRNKTTNATTLIRTPGSQLRVLSHKSANFAFIPPPGEAQP